MKGPGNQYGSHTLPSFCDYQGPPKVHYGLHLPYLSASPLDDKAILSTKIEDLLEY